MAESLLQQGFALMLYGMGVVFTFLTLLVGVTTLMSFLTNRYFPVAEPAEPPAPRAAASAVQDPQLIAVLSAAIREFKLRRDNKNK